MSYLIVYSWSDGWNFNDQYVGYVDTEEEADAYMKKAESMMSDEEKEEHDYYCQKIKRLNIEDIKHD